MMKHLFALLFICHSALALEAKVEGNVITLTGRMGYKTAAEWDQAKLEGANVIKLARNNPLITTLNLENMPGGSVSVADDLAKFVRDYRYNTVITGNCSSACTRIFIAGQTRQFTNRLPLDKTSLGFHGIVNNAELLGYSDELHLKYLSSVYNLDYELRGLIPKLKGNEMIYFFHPEFKDGVSICKTVFQNAKPECQFQKGDALSNGFLTSDKLFEIRR